MNWINSVIGILILAILVVIGYKVGTMVIEMNSPIIPKIDTANLAIPEQPATSVFLRWNHFPLTVYITTSLFDFPQYSGYKFEYDESVRRALDMWKETGIVSFSIVNSSDADIAIEWVRSLKEKATDTLGNTDIRFVNVSQFDVIQNAKIELLTKSDSKELNSIDMTNLALHEIGHAIGLQHTNEDDIMNPVLIVPSKNVKKVSTSDIRNLQELYKIAAKPDLKITEINATKFSFSRFGRNYFYLNVSINVQNVGLVDAENFTIEIDADNANVTKETISKLELGNILNIFQGNIRVDRNFTSVQVIVDPQNAIDELNKTNNFIDMPV